MKPNELAVILKDSLDEFEKWYGKDCKNKGADKDAMCEAYSQARLSLISQIQQILQDGFYENDKEITEGESLQEWLSNALSRRIEKYANDIVFQPILASLQNYNDLAMKQIRLILSAYSGKIIENDDDDDGIEGAEAEARHKAFDGTISAIASVKEGILNKAALARTFRALADFYENEW